MLWTYCQTTLSLYQEKETIKGVQEDQVHDPSLRSMTEQLERLSAAHGQNIPACQMVWLCSPVELATSTLRFLMGEYEGALEPVVQLQLPAPRSLEYD